jgi:hypothetical protein
VLGCPTLAACGSTGTPAGTVSTAGASATGSDPALQFARCLRAHGVSNFPDPTPQTGLRIPNWINPQSPAFQSAQNACNRFLPDKGAPPATVPGARHAAVVFAQCMRGNGVTGFPDPALTPPTGASRVIVLRGMVFALGSGLDPKSPAFRHAMNACGVRPPPL